MDFNAERFQTQQTGANTNYSDYYECKSTREDTQITVNVSEPLYIAAEDGNKVYTECYLKNGTFNLDCPGQLPISERSG